MSAIFKISRTSQQCYPDIFWSVWELKLGEWVEVFEGWPLADCEAYVRIRLDPKIEFEDRLSPQPS